MCFTKEDPRPRSSRLKELIKMLRTTHVPNSCTLSFERMYGVSSRLTRKLQERPSRLNNVFVTSFLENSPWRVTGSLAVREGRTLSSLIVATLQTFFLCRRPYNSPLADSLANGVWMAV